MDAADYLDALAAALHTAGWASRTRYESDLLQVFHPLRPAIGESVRVKPDAAGRWCFYDSYGELLGPCSDVPAAAEAMDKWLTAVVGG